jgi:hypothetical protein
VRQEKLQIITDASEKLETYTVEWINELDNAKFPSWKVILTDNSSSLINKLYSMEILNTSSKKFLKSRAVATVKGGAVM